MNLRLDGSSNATDSVIMPSGGLHFVSNVRGLAGMTADSSYVELYQNAGASIALNAQGFIRAEAPADISINANKNYFRSAAANVVEYTGGGSYKTILGNNVITLGKQNKEAKDASKALQDLAKTLQEQIMDEAMAVVDEEGKCPTCGQKTTKDEKSKIMVLINVITQDMPDFPYHPTEYIEKWIKRIARLLAGLVSFKSNEDLNPKKSCGPGCKNHMVKSLRLTLKKAEDAYDIKIRQNQDIANDHLAKLAPYSNTVVTSTNSMSIFVGLAKNESKVYFKKGYSTDPTGHAKGKQGIMTVSKGNCERMIYCPPIQLTDANFYLDVCEKFTVNAGAPGMAFNTNGLYEVKAAGINISASDGEAVFKSSNKTIIAGKNIKLLADDKSGDTNILLDAGNVHISRSASIDANLSVRGAITCEGPLSIPYLNCPTMEAKTETYGKQMASSVERGLGSSEALRIANTVNMAGKYAQNGLWVMVPQNFTSVVMEELDTLFNSITLNPVPAGLCKTAGVGFGVNGGGPMTSLVYSIGVVWNFFHNHGSFNDEHRVVVPVPLGKNFQFTEGALQASYIGGSQPAVAPVVGSADRPGPKSLPGPCGGGGLFTKQRDGQFGLDQFDDGFNGGNFVNRYYNDNTPGQPPPVDPDYSVWKYGVRTVPLSGGLLDC
jgi:hypothetical protein